MERHLFNWHIFNYVWWIKLTFRNTRLGWHRSQSFYFLSVCVYTKGAVSRVRSYCLWPGRCCSRGARCARQSRARSGAGSAAKAPGQGTPWSSSRCSGISLIWKVMLNYNNICRQPTGGKKWGELLGCLVGWFLSKENIPSWTFLF